MIIPANPVQSLISAASPSGKGEDVSLPTNVQQNKAVQLAKQLSDIQTGNAYTPNTSEDNFIALLTAEGLSIESLKSKTITSQQTQDLLPLNSVLNGSGKTPPQQTVISPYILDQNMLKELGIDPGLDQAMFLDLSNIQNRDMSFEGLPEPLQENLTKLMSLNTDSRTSQMHERILLIPKQTFENALQAIPGLEQLTLPQTETNVQNLSLQTSNQNSVFEISSPPQISNISPNSSLLGTAFSAPLETLDQGISVKSLQGISENNVSAIANTTSVLTNPELQKTQQPNTALIQPLSNNTEIPAEVLSTKSDARAQKAEFAQSQQPQQQSQGGTQLAVTRDELYAFQNNGHEATRTALTQQYQGQQSQGQQSQKSSIGSNGHLSNTAIPITGQTSNPYISPVTGQSALITVPGSGFIDPATQEDLAFDLTAQSSQQNTQNALSMKAANQPLSPASASVVGALEKLAPKEGTQRLQIQLDPPDLGKVLARVEKTVTGQISIVLNVDNKQAFSQLSRDHHMLEATLQKSGIDMADVQVDIEFSGDQDTAFNNFMDQKERAEERFALLQENTLLTQTGSDPDNAQISSHYTQLDNHSSAHLKTGVQGINMIV